MYSAYKLNKQGDSIRSWCTPFPIWNQSVVPCSVLTVASWPAYRFLKRQVGCSGIPISFRIPHSLLWWTQYLDTCYFFSSLTALLGSFKTMLNKSCESMQPFPLPGLRGKAFSSSPLSVMLAMGLLYIDWSMFLLCQLCWEYFFYHKWILTFAKFFLCIYWNDHMIFLLHFLNEMFHVAPSFHPWNKSHLSMLYDPLSVLLDLVC